jgi:hypothetical protein
VTERAGVGKPAAGSFCKSQLISKTLQLGGNPVIDVDVDFAEMAVDVD